MRSGDIAADLGTRCRSVFSFTLYLWGKNPQYPLGEKN
jgi:hypothetical protein